MAASRRWVVVGAVLLVVGLVAPAAAEEVRVATWNLEWFNDNLTSDDFSNIGRDFAAPSAQEFRERVETVADAIAAFEPTILALQEIENERVVLALAAALQQDHGLSYSVSFVEGRDSHTGQDVAFLVKSGVVFQGDRFDFSDFAGDSDFKDLSKHQRLDVEIGGEPVTVVAVHLITSLDQRLRQAKTLRAWTEELVPSGNVIVLGDFNTGLAVNETTAGSEMGVIRGFGTPDTGDDLFDVHQVVANRVTHVSGRELDRILVSPGLNDGSGVAFVSAEVRRDLAIRGSGVDSGNAVDYSRPQSEQDNSDHFPLIATFTVAGGMDGGGGGEDEDEVTREELLEALRRVEERLQDLSEEVEGLREAVEGGGG